MEAADALAEAERKRLDDVDLGESSRQEALKAIAPFEVGGKTRSYLYAVDAPTLIMAPLFYDQPLASICSSCKFIWNDTIAKKMAEEGLLIPVAFSPYHSYPREALALFSRIPHFSYDAVAELVDHDKEMAGDRCICGRCIEKRIGNVNRLGAPLRDKIRSVCALDMQYIPENLQESFINELRLATMRRSKKIIGDIATTIFRTRMLTESNVLCSAPQLFRQEAELTGTVKLDESFVAESLSISYSPEIPAETYLDIVRDYKGMLKPLSQEISDGKPSAMQRLEKINEEIRDIANSKRARLIEISTGLATGKKESAIDAAIGGSLAFALAGPVGTLSGAIAGPCIRKGMKAAAAAFDAPRGRLAKLSSIYYGSSIEAVQIWGIRKRLGQAKVQD